MSDYAKFSATLAKVNFNGKKTVVTLELDNRSAASNIDFLMENIDETVNVSLGDPQMKLDLPPGQPRTGVAGTIGPNGVVESVKAPADDDEDGEQEELEFVDDGEVEGVEPEDTDLPEDMQDDPFPIDEDPGWPEENQDRDMVDPDLAFGGDGELPEATNELADKQAIEQYILEVQPQFPEIAFDFPAILQRKREDGKTWIEVAKEHGVSSSVLQSAWHKYKGLVSKQMGTAS